MCLSEIIRKKPVSREEAVIGTKNIQSKNKKEMKKT